MSFPGALARLESPDIAPPLKKLTWKDESLKPNWQFRMHRNRHHHAYFGVPSSHSIALPRLQSTTEGIHPPIAEKKRNGHKSQSMTFEPFWMDRITPLHTYNRFPNSILSCLALLESPEGLHPPICEKRRNGKTSQSTPFQPFLTDRITHLHTFNRFPISILSCLALLESPEGLHPPISEKRRNGKTCQSRPFQPFWTDRNTRLHTYIRFPNSILPRLALLESPEGWHPHQENLGFS